MTALVRNADNVHPITLLSKMTRPLRNHMLAALALLVVRLADPGLARAALGGAILIHTARGARVALTVAQKPLWLRAARASRAHLPNIHYGCTQRARRAHPAHDCFYKENHNLIVSTHQT